jgi:predicted phage-related endonuclease
MTNIEITAKAKEYKELTQFIKQLQDEADALKAAITANMEAQNVDTLETDLFTIRWTEYQTNRLDSAKLKAEHADIYSQYSKTTTARRFQVA